MSDKTIHLQSENQFTYAGNSTRTSCGISIQNTSKLTQDSDEVTCGNCKYTNEFKEREELKKLEDEFPVMDEYEGEDMSEFVDSDEEELNENLQKAVENHNEIASATQNQIGGSHYKDFEIQPIQFVLENEDHLHPTDAFLINNVLKYCIRHRRKGGADDLDKSIHYIQLVKEHTYND